MSFCDGYAPIGAINSVLSGGCFLLPQACLKYFKIMDFINKRHTRQSERLSFFNVSR